MLGNWDTACSNGRVRLADTGRTDGLTRWKRYLRTFKVRHGLTNNQRNMTMSKTIEKPATEAVDLDRLVRDAMRYRAIKGKIEYGNGGDGMAWATLNWCVDVYSLSPANLDEAIDELLLANEKLTDAAT